MQYATLFISIFFVVVAILHMRKYCNNNHTMHELKYNWINIICVGISKLGCKLSSIFNVVCSIYFDFTILERLAISVYQAQFLCTKNSIRSMNSHVLAGARRERQRILISVFDVNYEII